MPAADEAMYRSKQAGRNRVTTGPGWKEVSFEAFRQTDFFFQRSGVQHVLWAFDRWVEPFLFRHARMLL